MRFVVAFDEWMRRCVPGTSIPIPSTLRTFVSAHGEVGVCDSGSDSNTVVPTKKVSWSHRKIGLFNKLVLYGLYVPLSEYRTTCICSESLRTCGGSNPKFITYARA